MWPHSWAWPQSFVYGVPYLDRFLLGVELLYVKCSEECLVLRRCRCSLMPSSSRATSSPSSGWDRNCQSCQECKSWPCYNFIQETFTKDLLRAKSCAWLWETGQTRLSLIGWQVFPTASVWPLDPAVLSSGLALPGTQSEERTQSGDWMPVLALLWPTRWPQLNPSLL